MDGFYNYGKKNIDCVRKALASEMEGAASDCRTFGPRQRSFFNGVTVSKSGAKKIARTIAQ